MKNMITSKILKTLLRYNADTGVFTRNTDSPRWKFGTVAGTKNALGYVVITIRKHRYYAHRLAWLYVTGEWPAHEIDHVNGRPDDNRFCNLRGANRSENLRNTRLRSDNISGFKGVCAHKSGKWVAQIQHFGKHIHLGYFASRDDALDAYRSAAKKYHGDFARTG